MNKFAIRFIVKLAVTHAVHNQYARNRGSCQKQTSELADFALEHRSVKRKDYSSIIRIMFKVSIN